MTNSVEEFLNLIERWANNKPDIIGVALVGSHARNEARLDSDIDLVILCKEPNIYLNNVLWLQYFGKVKSYKFEDWGKVTSVRVFYENIEVEFGLTSIEWAIIPVDAGTRKVVSDSMKILFDPQEILNKLLKAVATS